MAGPKETHFFKSCTELPIRCNEKEGTSTLYPLKLRTKTVYRRRVTVCQSQGFVAQRRRTSQAQRRRRWPWGDARILYRLRMCVSFGPCIWMPKTVRLLWSRKIWKIKKKWENTTRASTNMWQHSGGVFWGNAQKYGWYLNFKGPLPRPTWPQGLPHALTVL